MPTAPPSAPPSPAFVTETVNGVTFTRPSAWFEERPTVNLIPGSYLWLSSESLAFSGGGLPAILPTGFIPDGVLPAGGVVMSFYSGGILMRPTPSPMAILAVKDSGCAGAGGHAVRLRIEGSYLEACLNGSAADAAFQAFYASLRVSP